MHHVHVFTDGSVNSKLKVGYGAYLIVSDLDEDVGELRDTVKVKCFEQASSTRLELQTFLWALKEVVTSERKEFTFRIYTDCQNISSLPGRRSRLESNDYYSSNNKRLNNHELYQEFYQLTSGFHCEIVKVVGHQATRKKDKIDKLFDLVDRGARKALRQAIGA